MVAVFAFQRFVELHVRMVLKREYQKGHRGLTSGSFPLRFASLFLPIKQASLRIGMGKR